MVKGKEVAHQITRGVNRVENHLGLESVPMLYRLYKTRYLCNFKEKTKMEEIEGAHEPR